jgi:hypothetical protein
MKSIQGGEKTVTEDGSSVSFWMYGNLLIIILSMP